MPPNQSASEERECSKLWEQANNFFKQKGFDSAAKQVDQIHVKKTQFKKLICYKEENYMGNGWCKTMGWEQGKGGWGICSESCKYLKNEAKSTSEDNDKVYLFYKLYNYKDKCCLMYVNIVLSIYFYYR